jgi:anionic cell wall polymer biosynthesis LytR-Cps2A-Psr (LCP) family protein
VGANGAGKTTAMRIILGVLAADAGRVELGGVELTLPEPVLYGANTYDDGSPAPPAGTLPAGTYVMTGDQALWYARSRYGTNDYVRMERQREVQEAMLRQFEPGNIVLKFQAVAAAGAQVVSTDIPQGMLSHFVELGAKTRELPIEKLNFVPPEFDEVTPDFGYIRERVNELTAAAVVE